jgi:hypothetical protein
MKNMPQKNMLAVVLGILLLTIALPAPGQMAQDSTGPPAIEQQLVREGTLAIKLAYVLDVPASDETEAESSLAEVGITPKNGWIADYPVTPEVAGELRQAVVDAADAGNLATDTEEAIREFDDVLAQIGLPVYPAGGEAADRTAPAAAPDGYVAQDDVNSYYSSTGPPLVTYYPPPQDYTYLYVWVPYPFWTSGYLFPGFFILHDFHRTVFVHRRRFFITNHFRDFNRHRSYRIHPQGTFSGSTQSSVGGFRNHFRLDPDRARGTGGSRGMWSSGQHQSPTWQQGPVISSQPRSSINSQPASLSSRPSRAISSGMERHFSRSRGFTPSSRAIRDFSGNSGHGSTSNSTTGGAFRHDSGGSGSFSRHSFHGGGFSHGGRGRR